MPINTCEIDNVDLTNVVKDNKGEIFPVHAVKVYRESRGVAPLILNFVPRWRWVVNHTSQLLYPQEGTP